MTTNEKTTAAKAAKEITVAEAMRQLREAIAEARAAGQLTDPAILSEIRGFFETLTETYEGFTTVLSTAERRRLVGAGIKNHGFIEVCYEKAQEAPAFLPSYLPLSRFRADYTDFEYKQTIFDMAKRFCGLSDDTLLAASDVVYRDALAFYNTVREAARQKAHGAKELLDELSPYFSRGRYKKDEGAEPTAREVERDVRSLLHGTKDGRVVVENVKPVVTAGVRRVVDEVGGGHTAVRVDADETVTK